MKSKLLVHCDCCNAPAIATFDGETFEGVVCEKHGRFLSVPTMQVEAMRALLRERNRADALQAELRQAERAFAIADDCMRGLVESEGVKLDETGLLFGLCNDDRAEVQHLADASDALQEAWEWLDSRGLATLVEAVDGDAIRLSEVD